MPEWSVFKKLLSNYPHGILIAGKVEPSALVATKAVVNAMTNNKSYGVANSASRYIQSILERSVRDGVWPGEFPDTKPQKKLTPTELRQAIVAGKITMMDGKPLPSGEWGSNENGLYLNRELHVPAAEIDKRKFT